MMRWVLRSILLLFLCIISQRNILAQEGNNKSSAEVTLISWLEELEKKYEVKFSYNASLFKNISVIPSFDCGNLEQCLQYLKGKTSVRFDQVDANGYLIIPVRAKAQFRVVDNDSKEDLISIIAKVNDQSEVYLTPTENRYSLPDLFLSDTITIHSQFFEPLTLPASELLKEGVMIKLQPSTTFLNEVVVEDYLTTGVDSRLSDHSMQINMTSLGLLAGESDGDILTVLKNIPGVRTPDGKPGSLNFRGSTFDQTLIYLDEIPIYHTGHFFGTISPYNPLAIDEVDIYRGTLPAKWGGRVGGLIDIKTGSAISDSATASLSINTVYTAAIVKAPIVADKLGISFALRTSYPYNDLPPKLQAFSDLNFQGSRLDPFLLDANPSVLERFDVRFRDMNGKLSFKASNRSRLTVSFINIVNRFAADLNNRRQRIMQNELVNLDNWGLTGKWNSEVSDNINLSLGVSTSSLKIFSRNDEIENGNLQSRQISRNDLDDTRWFLSTDIKVTPQLDINTGYTLTRHNIEFDPVNTINGMPDPDMPSRNQDEAQIHSFHISGKQNLGTRFVMNAGLHSDYYTPLSKLYLDPRLTMSYKASDFIYLKASGGRSHQFIKQVFNDDFDDFRVNTQFWLLSEDRNRPLEGVQGMVGMLYEQSGWLFDIELYRRDIDNIDGQEGPNPEDIGSLQVGGIDLFVKKKWEKVETWVSYSASRAETLFRESDVAFYDQPHILNFTSLVNLNKWNFAISWGIQSGLPVIIPTLDPTDPNSGGQTVLNVPFDDRFPNQHQLDFSATYTFVNKSQKMNGIIGVSILNIYDQENIINIFQEKTRVNNPYRRAVGFAPNINLKLSF